MHKRAYWNVLKKKKKLDRVQNLLAEAEDELAKAQSKVDGLRAEAKSRENEHREAQREYVVLDARAKMAPLDATDVEEEVTPGCSVAAFNQLQAIFSEIAVTKVAFVQGTAKWPKHLVESAGTLRQLLSQVSVADEEQSVPPLPPAQAGVTVVAPPSPTNSAIPGDDSSRAGATGGEAAAAADAAAASARGGEGRDMATDGGEPIAPKSRNLSPPGDEEAAAAERLAAKRARRVGFTTEGTVGGLPAPGTPCEYGTQWAPRNPEEVDVESDDVDSVASPSPLVDSEPEQQQQ
jgi:hypothetical protein